MVVVVLAYFTFVLTLVVAVAHSSFLLSDRKNIIHAFSCVHIALWHFCSFSYLTIFHNTINIVFPELDHCFICKTKTFQWLPFLIVYYQWQSFVFNNPYAQVGLWALFLTLVWFFYICILFSFLHITNSYLIMHSECSSSVHVGSDF